MWIGRYTSTVSCAAKSACRILGPQQQVVTAASTSKEEVAEMDVDALMTPGLYLLTSTGRERMELGMEKPIAPPMWYNQPFDRFGSAAGVSDAHISF